MRDSCNDGPQETYILTGTKGSCKKADESHVGKEKEDSEEDGVVLS